MKGSNSKKLELARFLAEKGYSNILFLKPEDARKVLTEKRVEIVRTLKKEEIKSIRDLARKLDRNVSVVHQDLRILFEEGVIDFKKEKNSKIPILDCDGIFTLPLKIGKRKVAKPMKK